ncbi:MAG: CCA tRNA nucleotidyltransferase [Candidatus Omnitrophica bacterium]|nr:CCA tRNA nucleotidyltransferase [Candidatus Omnitrophota bacterium]
MTRQRVDVPPAVKPLLHTMGGLADEQGLAAYAVGGCVRDWLLGITRITDLDVAVVGDGIAFATVAARTLDATMTTYQQFGTASLERTTRLQETGRQRRVASEPLRIDVASCRKETYAKPAAYPKVTPGSIEDDLVRRDFTINAMAMAINVRTFGVLVDPFGGFRDLTGHRLRVLHPQSFFDDPSRILRAVRFAQRYGLILESKTAGSMKQALAAGMLARLNRGRLRKELELIVNEPDPVACLARLGRWLNENRGSRSYKNPGPHNTEKAVSSKQ